MNWIWELIAIRAELRSALPPSLAHPAQEEQDDDNRSAPCSHADAAHIPTCTFICSNAILTADDKTTNLRSGGDLYVGGSQQRCRRFRRPERGLEARLSSIARSRRRVGNGRDDLDRRGRDGDRYCRGRDGGGLGDCRGDSGLVRVAHIRHVARSNQLHDYPHSGYHCRGGCLDRWQRRWQHWWHWRRGRGR